MMLYWAAAGQIDDHISGYKSIERYKRERQGVKE